MVVKLAGMRYSEVDNDIKGIRIVILVELIDSREYDNVRSIEE